MQGVIISERHFERLCEATIKSGDDKLGEFHACDPVLGVHREVDGFEERCKIAPTGWQPLTAELNAEDLLGEQACDLFTKCLNAPDDLDGAAARLVGNCG